MRQAPLTNREQLVYCFQDVFSLKEMAADLNLNIWNIQKMKTKANKMNGRTARKKRIS